MSTATIASIIDQVKFDVLSKTQATDNANKKKEISRTFICEPEMLTISVDILTDFSSSRHCHRLSSKIFNLSLDPCLTTICSTNWRNACICQPCNVRRWCILWTVHCVRLYYHHYYYFLMLISLFFRALEAHIAKLTGKEAGLFLPSGTASNQIALRTHLKQPPYSVLCDHRSHINKWASSPNPKDDHIF